MVHTSPPVPVSEQQAAFLPSLWPDVLFINSDVILVKERVKKTLITE